MVAGNIKQLLIDLDKLEQKVSELEELKRKLHNSVEKQIILQSNLISALLSILVMYIYSSQSSDFFTRDVSNMSVFSTFFQMFIIAFMAWGIGLILREILIYSWSKDYLPFGQKFIYMSKLPKYQNINNKIASEIDIILDKESFDKSPLPRKYLNQRTLKYLINIIESNQLNSVEEALLFLDLETKNQKARAYLVTREDLVTQAQKMAHPNFKSDTDNRYHL